MTAMNSSLRWLFVDLNSYFASAEQELRPELRGRPVAIVPVKARSTCCIAVSYQARSFGIRTGMAVAAAQALCPQLELVVARPKLYVELHHRIRAAIEDCVPVHAALSCDEFCCSLMGSQREAGRATALALEIKAALRRVGSTLRCSVGIGPNRLLAKIATGMQKPDGLVTIGREHLPHALHRLELRDIPGIGDRMDRKLRRSGITTVEQVCSLDRQQMGRLWGGVMGERLWLELRGEDLPDTAAGPARTLSRQHILPPAQRTRHGSRQVAFKMLHDCVQRLRKQQLCAGGLGLAIYYRDHEYAFEAHHAIAPSDDVITLQQHFARLWEGVPTQTPVSLVVFLFGLTPAAHAAGLFPAPDAGNRAAVMKAMDTIQQRYGKNAVYLASIHGARQEAPTRISFGPPPPLDEFEP
jgi:DNA polymerase-4